MVQMFLFTTAPLILMATKAFRKAMTSSLRLCREIKVLRLRTSPGCKTPDSSRRLAPSDFTWKPLKRWETEDHRGSLGVADVLYGIRYSRFKGFSFCTGV